MCHPERGGYHFPGTATGPNLPRFSCAYKKSKPFVINKTLIDARAILSPLCRVSPQPSRYHFSNATVEPSSSGSGASFASDGRISCSQHLPQLHPELVERIDVPHHALREHAVLVQRHQRAQNLWRQPFRQNRIARPPPTIRKDS